MAFIVRIDKAPRPGKGGGTHGWQVRGPGRKGYYSKLFSDGVYGDSEESLKAAEAHLLEVAKDYPLEGRNGYQTRPYANNTSGVVGVFRSHHIHSQTGAVQEYWCAFVPDKEFSPWINPFFMKRFYINDERDDDEAFRLAVEFRQAWEEAYDKGPEALRTFWDDYYYDLQEVV